MPPAAAEYTAMPRTGVVATQPKRIFTIWRTRGHACVRACVRACVGVRVHAAANGERGHALRDGLVSARVLTRDCACATGSGGGAVWCTPTTAHSAHPTLALSPARPATRCSDNLAHIWLRDSPTSLREPLAVLDAGIWHACRHPVPSHTACRALIIVPRCYGEARRLQGRCVRIHGANSF
jgi:hypothetical protein